MDESNDVPENRVSFYKLKALSIYKKAVSLRETILNDENNPISEDALSVHLKFLEKMSDSFNVTHSNLEELDVSEIGSDLSNNFDDLAMEIEVRIRSALRRTTQNMPHHSTIRPELNVTASGNVRSRYHIPDIKLPTFRGGYTEWADFYSMFSTVIDQEPFLSKIEKFQHLRSCLDGPALEAVRSLEVSESNYDIALDILNNRFNNKRLIFQAHVAEILRHEKVEDGSTTKLRTLSDKLHSHMRALRSMGTMEEIAGCIIVNSTYKYLDSDTRTKWEELSPPNVIPTWDHFSAFLERRCQAMETMDQAMSIQIHSSQVGKHKRITHSKHSLVATNTIVLECVFCDNKGHNIYSCTRFGNLSPSLRLREARKLRVCFNCLKKGHRNTSCSSGSCRTCGEKHHTLLHINNPLPTSVNTEPANATTSPIQTDLCPGPNLSSSLVAASSPCSPPAQNLSSDVVLLATTVIMIKSRVGDLLPCRALLDSGSQINLITSRFAQRLQLKRAKGSVSVSGIGADSAFHTEGSVNLVIQSRTSDYFTSLTALVAPRITGNQPASSFDVSKWEMPSNISLADPHFNKSQRIDVLIGASLFYDILCVGQIKLERGLPIIQKTRLGWVVTGGGQYSRSSVLLAASSSTELSQTPTVGLDELVRRFWEVENCHGPATEATKEEIACEEHFKKHCGRLPSGEYCVQLPLKLSDSLLGDSYQQAYRRFLNLERKLVRKPLLKAQYAAFIKEYVDLNHMSPVKSDALKQCKFFLPHHCVLREDKTTTKLRVVFDGSACTSTGYSLNDILMSGPTIQPKLVTTLLRFRTFRIALTGDICKMYRCVRVSPQDSFLQCILWRDSPLEELRTFKLDTVTYGTKPAAFLAVRSMHQLAADESSSYPIGSEVVLRDFYVDDLLTGGDTTNEVLEIIRQVSGLLAKGNFKIRKWCSNDTYVLNQTPHEDRETFVKFTDGSDVTKTLGLAWNPTSDELLFSFCPNQVPSKPTKRVVLSTIARFYDPLGLIGPVITKAKIFLQQLWKEKLHWDESLPVSLRTTWINFIQQFDSMQQISFPRLSFLRSSNLEMHGFCDASMSAYGACIYAVSQGDNGVKANLLSSRSRVAPLKTITIPKLELCGAALLAQLMHEVSLMNFKCSYYCWCDSTVVLAWIKNQPSNFNVFVANRLSVIQELTSGMSWLHVPTDLNPADMLSRGSLPAELINSHLWKYGPTYLTASKDQWPSTPALPEPVLEARKTILITNCASRYLVEESKFVNSFPKMQRIFAYVCKFIHRRKSGITVEDLRLGTELLIRLTQQSRLSTEIRALETRRDIKASSSIASLSPFLDDCGLLRVGGRLKNSTLDFEARHPIILPKNHSITSALIRHLHEKHLHAGPQSLLAIIRQTYWPIGGRKTVAHVIQKCVRCFRVKPRTLEQIMADLPVDRVSESRAFLVTGVDYCGPFLYKSEVRNRPPLKCYMSIFICFSTKAVHIELVKDLTTSAFLSALRRFICTRGRPIRIWSDNATNFVGARNELAELKSLFLSDSHQEAVHQACLNDCIDWRFIPPRSPHFGGLWEASVKLAKHHLRRALGSSLLGFDELRTLACNICAIINSRPLFPLSENPADLDVLTPSHFLVGAPITTFLEPDLVHLNVDRLDRWQKVTQLQQIHVNDVVLVKDENFPPLKWPLARILELIPGADGVSRVALIRMATGVSRRALAKLCLLPLRDEVKGMDPSTGGVCSGEARV
ncbi:uncharacterized protein [Drosophila pseudoobscura]|uniref:Endonuclease n=2 Tax=Drosophila pseudoobscura pseudoobscura TaxID=46245 RepID=A0A6I8WEI0_DROPS|nr:uncharacterized protein LOC117185599 [Drosophila pseudoobscura]